MRREVITRLICHFDLDTRLIEQQYKVVFEEYFGSELEALGGMAADGLVSLGERIEVLPRGRLLIRNICMVFDRYLREKQTQSFSKVI